MAALADRLRGWTEADSLPLALRRLGEYVALRLWAPLMNSFPVTWNLQTARIMGWLWWTLSRRHRQRAMDHLRPALGGQLGERALRRVARASFEHFAQLYLVELGMTPRLINPWSWPRHVELGELGEPLRLLLGGGAILLTGHFGNYELLGYTLARLGLPLTAVMRPLDNPLINEHLMASRQAGGLTLLMKKGVSGRAGEVLAAGRPLCFIADQDAGRKGVFVNFFGRPASTYKSIGLLAMSYRVPIVVGVATRTRRGFHYRIDVERTIRPEEWEGQPDPLLWITQAYTAALEAAIRRHPEQYLWVHRRWKHAPRSPVATQQLSDKAAK